MASSYIISLNSISYSNLIDELSQPNQLNQLFHNTKISYDVKTITSRLSMYLRNISY